jgi:hypothetical protein
MPTFDYLALDESGKKCHGTVDAESEAEAIIQVREKGLMPSQVTARKAPADSGHAHPSRLARRMRQTDAGLTIGLYVTGYFVSVLLGFFGGIAIALLLYEMLLALLPEPIALASLGAFPIGLILGIFGASKLYLRFVPAKCAECGAGAFYDPGQWPFLLVRCSRCGELTKTPVTFRRTTSFHGR